MHVTECERNKKEKKDVLLVLPGFMDSLVRRAYYRFWYSLSGVRSFSGERSPGICVRKY